jgi:hypothetical protein
MSHHDPARTQSVSDGGLAPAPSRILASSSSGRGLDSWARDATAIVAAQLKRKPVGRFSEREGLIMSHNASQYDVMTGVRKIALVAVVGCFSGCAEEPAGQEGVEAYSFLVGSWERELEYLDYGDNRTLVQLPTSMSCERGANGTSLELTSSYVEPSGRVEQFTW